MGHIGKHQDKKPELSSNYIIPLLGQTFSSEGPELTLVTRSHNEWEPLRDQWTRRGEANSLAN